MAFDFATHVLKRQKHVHETNLIMIEKGKPNLVTEVPSAQSIMQAAGYDKAKKWGLLEPYKDSWGVNFNRPSNAWNKWASVFPNGPYYKP